MIVVLVFWKDSMDFRSIIQSDASGPSSEAELEDIIAQYNNDI